MQQMSVRGWHNKDSKENYFFDRGSHLKVQENIFEVVVNVFVCSVGQFPIVLASVRNRLLHQLSANTDTFLFPNAFGSGALSLLRRNS